ncbi:MAG: hypothetical protein ACREP6_04440 [Candidatus Binataceae bacterium]
MAKIADVSAGPRTGIGDPDASNHRRHDREKSAASGFGTLLAALAAPINSPPASRKADVEDAGGIRTAGPRRDEHRPAGVSGIPDAQALPGHDAVNPAIGLAADKKALRNPRFSAVSDENAPVISGMSAEIANIATQSRQDSGQQPGGIAGEQMSGPMAARRPWPMPFHSDLTAANPAAAPESRSYSISPDAAENSHRSGKAEVRQRTGSLLSAIGRDEIASARQTAAPSAPGPSREPAAGVYAAHALAASHSMLKEGPTRFRITENSVRPPQSDAPVPASSPKTSAPTAQGRIMSGSSLGSASIVAAPLESLADPGGRTARVRIETDGANPARAVVHEKSGGITASLMSSNGRAAEFAAASLPALHRSLQLIGLGPNQITAGVNSDDAGKQSAHRDDKERIAPRRENRSEATVFLTREVR